VVTYREYVTHRTPPRELAREIVARCVAAHEWQDAGAYHDNREREPQPNARRSMRSIFRRTAFAHRTDEASIAEQMGDVFVAAGLPRPIPADNDRVGGWMLMYQMLDADEWLLTENCVELIRTLPNLVRDAARVEDIEKMDGDDPADAARYGLKSRYGAGRVRQPNMPIEQRLAARVGVGRSDGSSDSGTEGFRSRNRGGCKPVSFLHRRR